MILGGIHMNICSNFLNSLNDYILMINDFLWTYILIALLIAIGLYFTIKTNFVQFKNIKEMFKLLGEGSSSSEKDLFHHSKLFVSVQLQELVLVI